MSALKTLGPNQRLNDEVVNSMFILLPPLDHVLVLDSFFYSYILQGEWERLKKHNALIRNGPKLFVRNDTCYCSLFSGTDGLHCLRNELGAK